MRIKLTDQHIAWIKQGIDALVVLSQTNKDRGIDMYHPKQHKIVASQLQEMLSRIESIQAEEEHHKTASIYMGICQPDERPDDQFTFDEWNQLSIAIWLTSSMCEYMESSARRLGEDESADGWWHRGDAMSELQNDLWSVRNSALSKYNVEKYGKRVLWVGVDNLNDGQKDYAVYRLYGHLWQLEDVVADADPLRAIQRSIASIIDINLVSDIDKANVKTKADDESTRYYLAQFKKPDEKNSIQ